MWHKIYKCRTRVIVFSLVENSKHLRNYKSGKVIHGCPSSINFILKTMCIFFKNNSNLHTLFAPMTYFHSLGYTLCVLNDIFAIEKDICFNCNTAVLCHLYLSPHQMICGHMYNLWYQRLIRPYLHDPFTGFVTLEAGTDEFP